MNRSEFLQKLQIKIDEMQLKMNPTVSMSFLHSIESTSGVKFPKEYVDFICKIGNGGQLPKRPDSTGVLLPIEQCNLERVSQIFSYTETHMWCNDDYDYAEDPEKLVEKSENGHFVFMECADGFSWDLIVTGKRRGEVWMFGADGMMRGKGLGFLEWVQLYLEDNLTQRMKDSKPQNDLDEYFERIRKKIKREKVVMNPTISIEKVREIEKTYHISLPEDYVAFITTIGDGCKLPKHYGQKCQPELRSIKECDFEKASKPFPLTERWRYGWNVRTGAIEYDIETDPEGKWAAVQYGQFCFVTVQEKPRLSYSLIISGECRGQIWSISHTSIARAGLSTFMSWFESYLDGYN